MMGMGLLPRDADIIVATVDLVARTGARDFNLSYLHDDKPVSEAGWYAEAFYCGARIIAENMPGPIQACEALAHRLLAGQRCKGCDSRVVLSPFTTLVVAERTCLWTRIGPRWKAACER